MEIKSDAISELVLPEGREVKSSLLYLKIIFIPAFLYALILLAYFNIINFKVEFYTLVMTGVIFFVALIFARHSAEYAYGILEQQKDEFKQTLKRYIMKHFLAIGKDTKSNANFDDFARAYIQDARNENFANIGSAIFPMMGILGTFISIALSMPNFSSSDTEALEQEIADLLSGVGTAFYVSIYGISLALWWIFFEKFGKSKIERLLNRQKNSTSSFFWTKEELEQRYLSESLQHFEKISTIFKQVSNEDFFAELDHAIDRKFGIFQDMLNVEEKAIRLSSEHIKQAMGELGRAQRDQRDLGKLYSEMLNGVALLNQNLKEINTRMSEQYNRLLDISTDKIHHFDKTLSAFDERVERFGKNFELYERAMLETQEKVFEGFKSSLFEGMHKFKEIYEEEKSIDAKIKMMDELKKEIKALDEETNKIMDKFDKKECNQEEQLNDTMQELEQECKEDK
ncbi:MotA/TolQ/ExbB proton channel family protein [Campylobacter hepaticus]|uniref:MotA/TolQ/ExbB proton channel family protein n=1 Tax=Campylobacter hepaticus TaxID=1813019 RepID=UPI0029A73E8F|nr:MotA/TolQ/ExbB proton channel family protein [Campylobacter hepaticus]MDX2330849.1 MotA/TolQ/ExbB proton channel family protein [Campylobacter hepaticus]MDX2371545.1 MotA/TolQ/ExbB proton channel family protein [Campylobacter hepaticus]MDX2396795.1 MotA/TolQ/ExbB proton channel family protein [Campylobacter hepaticus]MDX5508703.1 MotA/TolQ/ExbB proton channel family protein [Campylobacter hepaticus]